jgi:DNA-binding response OmpR family regulator
MALELTRRLKLYEATRTIPIIMLSAKGEESDIVAGLELGADDYITKPFSPRILFARVRAVFRRRSRAALPDEDKILIHGLEIHLGRHALIINGQTLDLTRTEFQVLASPLSSISSKPMGVRYPQKAMSEPAAFSPPIFHDLPLLDAFCA